MIAYFSLPGLYHTCRLNKLLLQLMDDYPHFFYENHKIESIYGCFPNSIWNGGRHQLGFTSIDTVIDTITYFNRLNIACNFTYTNMCLKEQHLYDTFCNLCMDILVQDNSNAVIINSELLEQYLREKYDGLKFISSTTKCIKEFYELQNECRKDYYLVVPDYGFNHDDRLLRMDNHKKVEMLVNAYCCDNCSERLSHYSALSKSQLSFSNQPNFHKCKYSDDSFYTISQTRKSFITVEQIDNIYLQNEINHFKIEGRTVDTRNLIESYIYYFAKPEYIDCVRILLREEEKNGKKN